MSALSSAQRRPGREPRRHSRMAWKSNDGHTFAQRRPGREPRRHGRTAIERDMVCTAQRRPGREPRRHAPMPGRLSGRLAALNEGRGANPGDTLSLRLEGTCFQRSTKAGARTPATPGEPKCRPWQRTALNEGRGANPGDTPNPPAPSPGRMSAQRRPGREPRRHNRCRSTIPPRYRAQRRPGREPRRHFYIPKMLHAGSYRSTKAGARTPATPQRAARCAPPSGALNEGRGANPGDTVQSEPAAAGRGRAQRRPGREPRRHR